MTGEQIIQLIHTLIDDVDNIIAAGESLRDDPNTDPESAVYYEQRVHQYRQQRIAYKRILWYVDLADEKERKNAAAN